MQPTKTVALINPNTSARITAEMVAIAHDGAGPLLQVRGLTAPFGAPLITTEAALDEAARAVIALAPQIMADAVIVSAFGDPAADELARTMTQPVVGIAEASMRAAAAGGRRFAVVTTTPALVRRIEARAAKLGFADCCVAVLTTDGDAAVLMSDPDALERAMRELAQTAIDEAGAEAIIVGGGPLGLVARKLRGKLRVPVIEPIPEAVRHIERELARGLPS